MKVINYLPYDDIGGVGYRTASAFNRHRPNWTYHAYRGAPSYLQYPEHTPWDWRHIVDDWNTADVVHVNDHIPTVGRQRPTVVTFHGTGFRETPAEHLKLARDARVLVSTLDLWLLAPNDTTWMPQMDDLDWLATFRKPHNGPLRIGHAPTNRALKSTHQFIEACKVLSETIPVEMVMIEGLSWHECLTLKGTCDILFDQTAYGYGGNAIEAWAMGIPVVCGAPDDTLAEYDRRFGDIPFVAAEQHTIRDALLDLVEPAARAQWGTKGRAHAERYHSYKVGVERLAPIYEEVSS